MGWIEDLGLAPAQVAALPPDARLELAAFLARWGYYADALPLLRQLTEDAPGGWVSAWRVEALVGTGSVREAVQLADDALARYPSDPQVLAARADALLASGRSPEAFACATDLVNAGGAARTLGLERMARCRLADGDLAGAAAAAEQSLALAPDGSTPSEPLRLLSQILRRDPAAAPRLADVRAEMRVAYDSDIGRLRRQLGGRPVVAARGIVAETAPEVGGAYQVLPPQTPPTLGGLGGAEPPTSQRGPAPLYPEEPMGHQARQTPPTLGGPGGAEPPPSLDDARRALGDVFGHAEFRPGQEEVVGAVLGGEDVLAVLPTGAGKSLCYQLPAALLPGATVVISPLIALMKDQLEGLPPALAEQATVVHSALEPGEVDERMRRIAARECRILYAAPERLRQWPFLDALRRARISLFVIDEAHCLSLWGHDFRPDYLFLGPTLRRLGNPPLLAMTATATPTVQGEVGERLGRDLRRISLGVFRPNLRLEVVPARVDEEKLGLLIELCRAEPGAVIVYANARERCEDLARMLRRRGVQALHYHAGLEREERSSVQDDFMSGRVRVVVATVAFGMGVDKADVRMVVHYNLPRSVESYYQEAGRAGRDGLPSRCVLLATPGDRGNLTRWMAQERLPMSLLRDTYRAVRRIAGASGVARVVLDDLLRTTGCAEETQLRVAFSLLERVGLLRRQMDVPRALTLSLRRTPEDPALGAVVEAARLRPGQSATVDPIELAASAGVAAGDLEGLLLAGREQGWLFCRSAGRDPLLEVPPPPADARDALDRLITAHEEQQRRRLDGMVGYVQTRGCRHAFIAEHFGERAPRCPGCDNCAPASRGASAPRPPRRAPSPPRGGGGPVTPRTGRGPASTPMAGAGARPSVPAGVTVLQCIDSLPFSVGKKGLANILRGSLAASIGPDRCRFHGALAGHSKADLERLANALVGGGYLARGDDPRFPTLSLTDKGRQAIANGDLR